MRHLRLPGKREESKPQTLNPTQAKEDAAFEAARQKRIDDNAAQMEGLKIQRMREKMQVGFSP
jgi:hypothetical protein